MNTNRSDSCQFEIDIQLHLAWERTTNNGKQDRDARSSGFYVGRAQKVVQCCFSLSSSMSASFLSNMDLIDRFANEISNSERGENGLNRPVTWFSLKMLGLLAISLNSSYCMQNHFRQVQRFPPPCSKKALECKICWPNGLRFGSKSKQTTPSKLD